MISVPPAIQSQLGEAVSAIADSDFWERWDTLVDVSGCFCLGTLSAKLTFGFPPSLGPCVEAVAIQPCYQQRCSAGRTLNLQALAATFPIQRAV